MVWNLSGVKDTHQDGLWHGGICCCERPWFLKVRVSSLDVPISLLPQFPCSFRFPMFLNSTVPSFLCSLKSPSFKIPRCLNSCMRLCHDIQHHQGTRNRIGFRCSASTCSVRCEVLPRSPDPKDNCYGILWNSMDFYGYLWNSVEFYGILCYGYIDFPIEVPMGSPYPYPPAMLAASALPSPSLPLPHQGRG